MPLGAKRVVGPTTVCGVTLEPALSKALSSLGRTQCLSHALALGRRPFVDAEDSHKRYLRTAWHRLVLLPTRDTSRCQQQTLVRSPRRAFGDAFAPERFLPLVRESNP